MHFMSTYANSWIKVAARQNIIWIRFGNRRAVRRRRAEAGMALTAIGEFTQWGGVADCSGSRTEYLLVLFYTHTPLYFMYTEYGIYTKIHPRKKEKEEGATQATTPQTGRNIAG